MALFLFSSLLLPRSYLLATFWNPQKSISYRFGREHYGPTDGLTDKPPNGDARTHLKIKELLEDESLTSPILTIAMKH